MTYEIVMDGADLAVSQKIIIIAVKCCQSHCDFVKVFFVIGYEFLEHNCYLPVIIDF